MDNNTIKVSIETISGQSHHTYKDFYAEFSISNIDIISDCISSILSYKDFEIDEYYLNCKDDTLKINIIESTIRKNPKTTFVGKELGIGENFGKNINITFPKDSRSLTNKKDNDLVTKQSTP